MGEVVARAARRSDAHGVEAGQHKEILKSGRFADDKVVVGRETFRPVDEFGEFGRGQRGNPMFAVGQRLGEFLPIWFQKFERKVIGHRFHCPRFGKVLERAEHHGVAFASKIQTQVRIASDR